MVKELGDDHSSPQKQQEWCLSDIRSSMPPSLFKHQPHKSLIVLVRDFTMAAALVFIMRAAEDCLSEDDRSFVIFARCSLWLAYWWFQGLICTGIWVIGHECAHGSFLPWALACDVIGWSCHTLFWTPFFSWRCTHRIHHRYHGSMTKDQHWVPKSRSEIAHDFLSDTPLFNFVSLVVQQLIGFPLYLIFNTSGPKDFPSWTSHLNPNAMFYTTTAQRIGVVFSDISLLSMGYIVSRFVSTYGGRAVFMYYGIPCLLVSHWVTMIVYLHHTDPAVPHYRDAAWTYTRGALATIDRDFLGWQGRFFLHDIAHFHVVHHLFPRIPFYNGEEATKHLRGILGSDYRFSTTSVLASLWTNVQHCRFVEEKDEIVYYKDMNGLSAIPHSQLVKVA